MTNIKEVRQLSVKEQARQEVLAELNTEQVKQYKELLKKHNAAKQIVKNIERELTDLEEKFDQTADDINK